MILWNTLCIDLVGPYKIGSQNNKLTGMLPREFGQLASAWYLGLANNSFTGTIPEEFSRLNPSIASLDLQVNPGLNGTIPEGICNPNGTCIPVPDVFPCAETTGFYFDCSATFVVVAVNVLCILT